MAGKGDRGSTWEGPNEEDTWTDDRSDPASERSGRSELGRSDRYGTGRRVGRGALGRVVRVFDRRLARDVARKELVQQTSRHRKRFLREARITARLEHPNIVPVHDAGETADGTLFYTMRYVRGRSLGEAIEASPDLAARLGLLDHMVDVCQAIAYAHSQGVVHRDLKPDNIMLGAFGETWVVDWGLARFIERGGASSAPPDGDSVPSEAGTADITREGAVVGTPLYMSPEQAAGQPVDPRSEVWSLGAVLFHLVVGHPPFRGTTARSVIDAVLAQPVPRVEAMAPDCPKELAAIIGRALARRRVERYASTAALADDLRGFLQGRWVSAYRYGLSERLTRVLMRNRALVVVAAVAGLALVGIGVAGDFRVRAERVEARSLLAQSLAERALWAADHNDLLQARLLAVRGLSYGESPASRGVLAQVTAAWSPGLTEQWPWEGGCHKISIVDSGHALACVNGERAAWLDEGVPRWRIKESFTDVAVSPDRTEVALVNAESVRVVSADDGSELRTYPGGDVQLNSVAWSEHGLAWSGRSGIVRTEAGGEWTVGCQSQTSSLEWSEDGRIAVACVNAKHFLIDPDDPQAEPIAGHSQGASYAVAVHPEMTEWLGGASLGRLQLWNLPDSVPLGRLEGDGSFLYTAAWSPDGTLIAGGTDGGRVLIWDARYGDLVARIPAEGDPVATFAFTGDGHTLVTAGGRDVRRWTLPVLERHVIEPSLGQGEGLASAWVDEEHGLAWARQGNGRIVRWNLATGASIGPVSRTVCREALALIGTPAGPVLTCREGKAVLLDRLTAEATQVDARLPITDGRWISGQIIGVNRNIGVMFVDVPSMEVREVLDLGGEPYEVYEGQQGEAWISSREGDLWVVDVERREVVRRLKAPEYAPSLAVAPDGETVVVGTRSGDIYVLDAEDGRRLRTLEGHAHLVTMLEYRESGQMISSSWDNTLRVWDMDSRTTLAVLRGHSNRVSGLAQFGPDQLLSWSWDQTGRIWSLADLERSPDELIEEAERLTGMRVED